MIRDRIHSCIEGLGHTVRLADAGSKLLVEFVVQGRTVTLVHTFPDELLRIPKFYLVDDHEFGKLAHVGVDENGEYGEVCIADPLSTAINIDKPELAYRDTVEGHVQSLTRLIEDPAYNRTEQLREFDAHWKILCDKVEGGPNELFVAWEGDKSEGLQTKQPRSDVGTDLHTRPIAMTDTFANDRRLTSVRAGAEWDVRPVVGRSLAIRLDSVEPVPGTQRDLLEWYFDIIAQVDRAARRELRRLQRKRRCDYWLVFSAPVPDGKTMFAFHWHSRSPCGLPTSTREAAASCWTATPYRIRSLSQASLVPRGGGSLSLSDRTVLLVGCGSVGSELALRLTSTGVGHLTISDPDTLSEENLYRHTLSVHDIGRRKAEALARDIALKHPWAEVTHWYQSLENLRESAVLGKFDLIVIAIGSPNVERAFAEYCIQEQIDVPVINCWLEGYGIGGHAILVVPGTSGCWHCAYVDPDTLTRGLSSNLNFLAPNQSLMRNQGGCGTQFLPYSGIAAAYTASVAADLAVRFLQGHVTISSKVSWKGTDTEVRRQSLSLTWRYDHFTDSLQTLPLHDKNCDSCGA
ncbi:MAG: ThiF family adenylyltransferase [bacterium]|nr:ThiF family adenylyltransferase [bacterium]